MESRRWPSGFRAQPLSHGVGASLEALRVAAPFQPRDLARQPRPNLARSSHSFVLRLRFGGAKGSTLVDIFMIYPDDWLVTAESDSVLVSAISWHVTESGGGGRAPVK
jgi:hypothetical protein